ncbi:MAG: GNAT family N-acetyltransferase [Bacillota bacterium]|nr:GNAT family N-acetyltransferase [Bacillota bacterium]
MDSLSKEFVTLNKLGTRDVIGLVNLSKSIGWDYDELDIKTVFSCGYVFGHKNKYGEIVSSAAIIPYESKLASIGMVIVHKNYRNLGLGNEVTKACIDILPLNNSILLISTKEGKSMYERMGFISIDHIHKLIGKNIKIPNIQKKENLRIEPINEEDINQIIEFDKEAFGDKRTSLIKNRLNQSYKSLIIRDEQDKLRGFGLSIKGTENLILGPIVAFDIEIAYILILELTKNYIGKVRIDIPSGQNLFIESLKELGFNEVGKPPIMILGSEEMPKRNRHLYGIAAQIFG